MPKIIPLRELKNASKISEMCHKNYEPIFVTKNGVSDLVILTSEKYDSINSENNYSFNLSNDEVHESDIFKYIKDRDNKEIYTIVELKQVLSPIFKKHKVKKAYFLVLMLKGQLILEAM